MTCYVRYVYIVGRVAQWGVNVCVNVFAQHVLTCFEENDAMPISFLLLTLRRNDDAVPDELRTWPSRDARPPMRMSQEEMVQDASAKVTGNRQASKTHGTLSDKCIPIGHVVQKKRSIPLEVQRLF